MFDFCKASVTNVPLCLSGGGGGGGGGAAKLVLL